MRDIYELKVGDLIVDRFGINKIVEVEDDVVTAETIIPKDIFVEAYNKFIAEPLIYTKEVHIKEGITAKTIESIYGALLEAGNHDTKKFKLGEQIRYTPTEVADILTKRFLGET